MRTHVLRVGIVVALTLGALAFLGLVVAVADLSGRGTNQARLLANLDKWQVASGREGGFWITSYPLAGVSARRIITDPGINSPLILTQNGREVLVTGHFDCQSGEDYEIQTAVTQSSTGALSRGRTQGRCSGRTEQFEAATWVYDEALFEAGTAQACAMIITRARNKVTDVFQWCRKEDVDLLITDSKS
jgi:hypothetical protein